MWDICIRHPRVTIDGYSAIHFFVIYYLGMYLSTVTKVNMGGQNG